MNRARYILKYLLPREKFIEKPYKRRHLAIIEILPVNLSQYIFRVIFFKIYVKYTYGLKYVAPKKYQSIRVPFLEYFVHSNSASRTRN